jgi:cytosine/creatinine deaminase
VSVPAGLSLTNALGVAGTVRIDGDVIAEAGPGVGPQPGDEVLDLTGYVLLPGLAEPHVHLDKAFTAERAGPLGADLAAAIRAWFGVRGSLTPEDFAQRGRSTALEYLASGVTALRAHTDVSPALGIIPVAALRQVRAGLSGAVDIDIAAMAGLPLTGLAGRENLAALRDAIDAGADTIGGAPWLDPEPRVATALLLDLAAAAGKNVDLHVDETTDPASDALGALVHLVGQGFPHRVTASHVVSLASRAPVERERAAQSVAEAGVSVVTLPQTNLWLQEPTPANGRGITAVTDLLAAGVSVAAGADNIRDPFNPLGRADPLETAALLAAVARITPKQALQTVTAGAWAVLGADAPAIRPGAPARLVAVAARDSADAVASAPASRIVIRGSQVVARTRTEREYPNLKSND